MQLILDDREIEPPAGLALYLDTTGDPTTVNATGWLGVWVAKQDRWITRLTIVPGNASLWSQVLTCRIGTDPIDTARATAIATLKAFLPRADAIHGAARTTLENPHNTDPAAFLEFVKFWEQVISASEIAEKSGYEVSQLSSLSPQILESLLDAVGRRDRLSAAEQIGRLLEIARSARLELPGD